MYEYLIAERKKEKRTAFTDLKKKNEEAVPFSSSFAAFLFSLLFALFLFK